MTHLSMSLARVLVPLITLALGAANVAAAQSRPSLTSLAAGDTVKVWSVTPRLNGAEGLFNEFRADTLTLGALPFGSVSILAKVPYSGLRRVDVRRGTHRSTGRIVAGVLIGGLVGGALGAAIGPAVECRNGCPDYLGGLAGFVYGAGAGIAVGSLTGGIIGARRTGKWVAVLR